MRASACPERPAPAAQSRGQDEGPCSPSVRVPVAVHVPSPRAARSRTLEDVLVHGEDLAGRGRENSAALAHGAGVRVRRSRPAPATLVTGVAGETRVGAKEGGLHLAVSGVQSGLRCGGRWRAGAAGKRGPPGSLPSPTHGLGPRSRAPACPCPEPAAPWGVRSGVESEPPTLI